MQLTASIVKVNIIKFVTDTHTIVYHTISSKKFVISKLQVEEILGGLATLVPLSLVRHLFTPTQVIISVLKLKLRLFKFVF